jgi:peptidoglycan hydrolase-like protein with peptidoglycan-binding domain
MPKRRAVLLTTLLAVGVTAAPAAAQDPAPVPAPVPAPAPAPAPAPVPEAVPAPAAGTLAIGLEKINGRRATVVAGTRFRVRGGVTPYVAGQQVVLTFSRAGRQFASRTVTVRLNGATGTFLVGFRSKVAGRIVVRAAHAATPEQVAMAAAGRGVDVLPASLQAGARGAGVRLVQARLAALGYVVGRAGVLDDRTSRAVLAFRKVTGMARTTEASRDVMTAFVQGEGAFRLRFPQHGKHVEADVGRQVVVLADGGRVQRIYPMSSGKASTPTVLGSFKVYRKDPGTNAIGMVYSSYFIRGYAIHGYHDVPTYNASHGCLRVPIPDAISIYTWVTMGTVVDVYA